MQGILLSLVATLFLISAGQAKADKFCELVEGNYLLDPEFAETGAAGGSRYWVASQHAGEPSFDRVIEDGELRITKTGTQPWYYFRQNVTARELAGKKVAVNVELKLDLEEPSIALGTYAGGGLKIVARSSDLKGRKLLLRSILDHQPRIGNTDWFPVQVVVKLPKNTATVEVGILHQADGELQVRNLSLQLVDESAGRCKVSPNTIKGVARQSSGLR